MGDKIDFNRHIDVENYNRSDVINFSLHHFFVKFFSATLASLPPAVDSKPDLSCKGKECHTKEKNLLDYF